MKIIVTILLLLSVNVLADDIWTFSITENIDKFYNQAYLSHFNIKHFTVDGARIFEQQLSKGLSDNPDIAKQQIQTKLTQNNPLITQQIKQAWQGAVNAQSLGIEKIPAITFDKGRTVIYGEFNLLSAYKIWQKKSHTSH